jgi:hypothetical protein
MIGVNSRPFPQRRSLRESDSGARNEISFLDAAQSEFDDAIDYSGFGFEFAEEVEQALERINHYPEAWSPLSLRVRRCVANQFPYNTKFEAKS